MNVFLSAEDYALYLEILRERCQRHEVAIWAYCLLPNHIHLLAAPETTIGLARAIGEAHRKYATRLHKREGWTGHLWQQRFYSCPLDERHLYAAARYVLRNPVRSGLVASPVDWPWSSARAHLELKRDPLIDPRLLARRSPDWDRILRLPCSADEILGFRLATRAGFWPSALRDSEAFGTTGSCLPA